MRCERISMHCKSLTSASNTVYGGNDSAPWEQAREKCRFLPLLSMTIVSGHCIQLCQWVFVFIARSFASTICAAAAVYYIVQRGKSFYLRVVLRSRSKSRVRVKGIQVKRSAGAERKRGLFAMTSSWVIDWVTTFQSGQMSFFCWWMSLVREETSQRVFSRQETSYANEDQYQEVRPINCIVEYATESQSSCEFTRAIKLLIQPLFSDFSPSQSKF